MTWLPIGPDFSFNPKNQNFKRVSRRNSWGNSCMLYSLTVDPTDNRTIYVIDLPNSGGAAVFRTRNDGASWEPILDDLHIERDPLIDATCIAVNPAHPETIYMGTFMDQGVYVSNSRGDPGSWSPKHPINGRVRKLLVDPSTAAHLARTVLYAATDAGVFVSTDGGSSWPADPVLPGDIWSLCANFPASGAPTFYAGLNGPGAYYSTHPRRADSWQLLNTGAPGMLPLQDPTTSAGNFGVALVDFSLARPQRVYVWLIRPDHTVGLYTTETPPDNWISVPMTDPPGPAYGYYAFAFAVAPNSPGTGDGSSDILFIGSETLWRSTDGGRTWHDDRGFMSDFHDIKFGNYRTGAILDTYIGCDGGLGRSDLVASPGYIIPADHGAGHDGDYNELEGLPDLGFWQNLNYGRHAASPYTYASDPAISALGYLALQDGGIDGGAGLGWLYTGGFGDGFQVAAKQAGDGVRLWIHCNSFFGTVLDTGAPGQPVGGISLGLGGPGMLATSRTIAVGPDGNCVSGAKYTDAARVEHIFVTRVGVDGIATQISPDFTGIGDVVGVAVHPTDPNTVACHTGTDQVAMTTAAGTPGATWNQFGLPSGTPDGIHIAAIAIDRGGKLLVLLTKQISLGSDPLRSPLLQWTGSGLVLQDCRFPADFNDSDSLWFGKILAHPLNADQFYAVHADRVFRLRWAQMRWNWEDISDGLPGMWVYDLWIGNVAPAGAPQRFLLRAAVTTRSVWERDVTDGAGTPDAALYVRDNLLDQWWLSPSPSGVPSPYAPGDPGRTLHHYQCADLKIDAQQAGTGGVSDFFQTDPEAVPVMGGADPNRPMTHAVFNLLQDNSQHLPSLDHAWVHVQVHNHSNTPADGVSVWVLFCRAASGVANLNSRTHMDVPFDFWGQFNPDGTIHPGLPEGSPWVAVGPPITLNGLSAATPQVASWPWTVPALDPGDPGHHCMVVFVHSHDSPLHETSTEVDVITPRTKQIGQKNLHIGRPLSAGGMGVMGSEGEAGGGHMDEYVEFHNASAVMRQASLVFDLRGLPPQLRVKFRLSRVETRRALSDSILGAHLIGPAPSLFSLLLERFLAWLAGLIRSLLALFGSGGTPTTRSYAPIRDFGPKVYEAEPSAQVTVQDVLLPPFGFVAARFSVENTGQLPAGHDYLFHVQQLVKDRVVGGSQYVARIAGRPAAVSGVEREEVEIEEALKHLPPWISARVEQRIRQFGIEERGH